MAEKSIARKMVEQVTPWLPALSEIAHICFWLHERYQDIQSIPDQLKVVRQYCDDLAACIFTLKRVCLPEGTKALHPDDINSIIVITTRSAKKMSEALEMIKLCAEKCPKRRSDWDAFCAIFNTPDWMRDRNTVCKLMQEVKSDIEFISIITAANTHEKVCQIDQKTSDMERKLDEMKEMLKMAIATQTSDKSASSHQTPKATNSGRRHRLRNKREKPSSPPEDAPSTLSPKKPKSLTDLEGQLANLVAGTERYIWYGVPTKYNGISQSETDDMKAIVIMELDSSSPALACLVLDIASRKMTVLKIRNEQSTYVTIPSRKNSATATILVEEINFGATTRPLLMAGPSSSTSNALQNKNNGTINVSFEHSRAMTEFRSILEGYIVIFSCPCTKFRCSGVKNPRFKPLNSRENTIIAVAEIIEMEIGSSDVRVLRLWTFGGVNEGKNWSLGNSMFFLHQLPSGGKCTRHDKTLYLDISMVATQKSGVTCFENDSSEDKVSGKFELTFEHSKHAEEMLQLLTKG